MNETLIQELGDALYEALIQGLVIDPLTERYPEMTIVDAYRVQQQMNARRIAAGETIIGKKIGVTSQAVMNMLGVNQPDFGLLTDRMVYNEGDAIPMQSLIQPRAEGEIAFVLKKDLCDRCRCPCGDRRCHGVFRDRRQSHPRLEDQDSRHGC